MIARLARSVPIGAVLVGTWLLLQGEWSVANLAGGLVLAAIVLVLFPVSGTVLRHRLHPGPSSSSSSSSCTAS